MIGWGKAVALFLAIIGKLAEVYRDHQLRKAGRMTERAEIQGKTLDLVRAATGVDIDRGSHSLRDDPDDVHARRSVPRD